DLQHVFHVGDKGRAGVRRNHPLLLAMRFENAFFSVRPIVLSLARSTMCSSTTFSSSRRRLQRAKPSRAGERVSAISFASATPSKIRGRAELGLYLRLNTASNPSSTNCPPGPLHGGDAGVQRPGDRAVAPAFARIRHVRLQEDARLRQQLRRALAGADQIVELIALLRTQPDHVFLDGDLFPGHESPPSLACGDRDSEIPVMINDEGD